MWDGWDGYGMGMGWVWVPSKILHCRLKGISMLLLTHVVANSQSLVDHIQLVFKKVSTVKLGRTQSPNILSDIIGAQEKGGEGKKFSSGNLLKDSHIVQWLNDAQWPTDHISK